MNHMKKFIAKLVLLSGIIGAIIISWCMWQKNDILTITNSISLDARLYEMKNMDAEHFDVVALGSSMTLYQLDGETFVQHLNEGDGFYNFSAWGLQISDSRKLLEYLVEAYTPHSVVIFGNIADFDEAAESIIDMKAVRNYLDDNAWNDIRNTLDFGYPNNRETKKMYMDRRYAPTELNEDLRYDKWGGVLLNVYGEDILKARYDAYYTGEPRQLQYDELAYIAKYLADRGIKLYYVQTPCREHYLSERQGGYDIFVQHCDTCRDIIESNGGYYQSFFDYNEYTDVYFADCIHLNKDGALKLTEEFCRWYDEINR